MSKRLYVFLISWVVLTLTLHAQPQPPEVFSVELEDVTFGTMPGLQSYAYGTTGGRIILMGGRIGGLHGSSPFNSFPVDSANKHIWMIDPVTQQVWSAQVGTLSTSIAEQLQGTNPQFVQRGNYLYITGGYGYKAAINNYVTWPNLLAVRLDSIAIALQNGTSVAPYIRQVNYPNFAVSGGHLDYIDSIFYLVGGHKFDGRYNAHNGASYTQAYTNAIRKFKITDDGQAIVITDYSQIYDSLELHRRDYNMAPQVFPDGSYGFTAFTGVFRYGVDLPFFNMVNIKPQGYQVINNYQQLLNQYHTANLPLFDSAANVMHTIFFGGMGMYTYDAVNQTYIVDSAVPFVKTISMMSRFPDSSMTEVSLPVEMPGFLGSSAEFIFKENAIMYEDGIVNLNQLDSTRNFVGYILGGIESTQPNVFNQAAGLSVASKKLFKVYINKSITGISNPALYEEFNVRIFPNPASSYINIALTTTGQDNVQVMIRDYTQRLVQTATLEQVPAGKSEHHLQLKPLSPGIYLITLMAGQQQYSEKVVISR